VHDVLRDVPHGNAAAAAATAVAAITVAVAVVLALPRGGFAHGLKELKLLDGPVLHPDEVPVHVGNVGQENHRFLAPVVDHPAQNVGGREHVFALHGFQAKGRELCGHEVAFRVVPVPKTEKKAQNISYRTYASKTHDSPPLMPSNKLSAVAIAENLRYMRKEDDGN
jgi:hypothetical protein